jgi:hypothetical protein
VVQRHSGSDLPPQVTAGRVCGFPVGQVMQGLQHQDLTKFIHDKRGKKVGFGKNQPAGISIPNHPLTVLQGCFDPVHKKIATYHFRLVTCQNTHQDL